MIRSSSGRPSGGKSSPPAFIKIRGPRPLIFIRLGEKFLRKASQALSLPFKNNIKICTSNKYVK